MRARTAPRMNDDASSSSQLPGGSPGGRPTAAERAEALSVIRQMKEAEPPILSRRGAPPKPNVVACAIALYRGEVFESDADALRIFGAAETTMVRRDWVEDKLARFAPAGFNTPGEPLPSYLLDRPEGSTTGFDPELPSYVHLEALRARFAPSQAALDGSEEAAEADEYWLTGHLREMARRESEFVAWAAVHAAERDAQHEQLAAEGLEFYWALGSCIGRKPKWELRNAECLEGDRSRTIGSGELGVDEPLLMYREFRPFTGDVLKAEQFFGADTLQRDYDWLDSERVRLEPEPTDATRGSRGRCIECGQSPCDCPCFTCYQHECQCPASDAENDVDDLPDAYGNSSADCHYDGAAVHEQLQRDEQYQRIKKALLEKGQHGPIRVCAKHVLSNDMADPDLEYDLANAEHGRISLIHGRPWDEVPPNATAPVHWFDSLRRPWEQEEWEQEQREKREHRERLERMRRANIPPPYREDARYGALTNNSSRNEAFHKDRAVWYEHVTGDSLDGLSLAEQRERVDVIARRFRVYNDGRAPRPRELMPPE